MIAATSAGTTTKKGAVAELPGSSSSGGTSSRTAAATTPKSDEKQKAPGAPIFGDQVDFPTIDKSTESGDKMPQFGKARMEDVPRPQEERAEEQTPPKVVIPAWNPDGTPYEPPAAPAAGGTTSSDGSSKKESDLSDEELKKLRPSHYVDKVLKTIFEQSKGNHAELERALQPMPTQLQPQPKITLPEDEVDYGYSWEWPDTTGLTEKETVLKFCGGLNGRHGNRRVRIYMMNSAYSEYTRDCMAEMFKRFRGTDQVEMFKRFRGTNQIIKLDGAVLWRWMG